jgi:hypothetical protein
MRRRRYAPVTKFWFLHQIDADDAGCWIWRGAKTDKGYGHFKSMGKTRGAHRTAYELFVGPIPTGLYVLHRCDVPPCCNPAHLFVGTNRDNVQDAIGKGVVWGRAGRERNLARRLRLAQERS